MLIEEPEVHGVLRQSGYDLQSSSTGYYKFMLGPRVRILELRPVFG